MTNRSDGPTTVGKLILTGLAGILGWQAIGPIPSGSSSSNPLWRDCDERVHTVWLNIEVDNECDARGAIPPSMTDQARVVEVRRFTANEVRDLHE